MAPVSGARARGAARLALLVGGQALGAQLSAEPVPVVLDWQDGNAVHSQARVCAVRRTSPDPASGRCESEAATSAEATLDLAPGSWSLRAETPGFWSPTVDVDVASGQATTTRITLWPSATLLGTFVRLGAEPPASRVDLHFMAAPNAVPGAVRSPASELSGTSRCAVQDERWSCSLPAGVFDLALRAEGFVPHYLWDVALTAGRTTALGTLVLRRGASISGRIVRADGSVPKGPCQVEMWFKPPFTSPATPEAERLFATTVGTRGFFQLAGVPPGERELAAECPVVHAAQSVSVRPDQETRLVEPVVVEGLALDVQVVPPLDPLQRPWRLDVFRFPAERQQIASRVPVSAEGRWSRRNLTSDTYQVNVVDETGAQWQSKPLVLTETSGALVIQVPTLKIAGRVRLTTTPLRAQVVFLNDSGSMRLVLQSDDDGRFQGFLVSAAEAWERGWAVQVHATSPPVNHRLENVVLGAAPGAAEVWIDLTVPGASARGTVISPTGQPQPGAQVLSFSLGDTAATYAATTDEQGTFELLDLPPGRYRVSAETESALSFPQEIEVIDGAEQELRLVLAPQTRLVGRVVSAAGPIPGAAVHVWLAPGLPRGSTTTDDEGRFEFGLPADAQEVGVTVAARGYALHMRRARVDARVPLALRLDTPAGTLVLRPSKPERDAPPASVLLVHNEALESLETVVEWAVQNGGSAESERVVVPGLEPGVYSLCRVPAGDVASVWAGTGQAGCPSGNLSAGAALWLSDLRGRESP